MKNQDDKGKGGEKVEAEVEAARKGTDNKQPKPSKKKDANKTQELMANLQESKDENLRLQAEIQNAHKRFAQELTKARSSGTAELASSLLETVDNLEKALSAYNPEKGGGAGDKATQVKKSAEASAEKSTEASMYQGVELTYQTLLDVLKRFNIKELNPLGDKFNPEYHEALSKVKVPGKESGSIIIVIQKGYMIENRLLRAAKVQVAE